MIHEVLSFPFEPEKTVIDGRFLVKGELGQGGMGRCYRVWQSSVERVCVLKMLAPKLHPRFVPQHDARLLLENEAKTLGLLAEGNDSFVQVFDRGKVFVCVRLDGEPIELDLPYYVMEFLHGHSFEALIASFRGQHEFLPWIAILGLAAQAARALSIAHERGVIHRDIKPDNIFLQQRQHRLPCVKFIDFGVSTREGAQGVFGTGTTRYGAPELLSLRAERESTQSDIYPLGLVIYELAALRGPFMAASKKDYLQAHVFQEAPPLSQFRLDAPPALTQLVAAALAKAPDARPTASEFADALDVILAGTEGNKAADAQISQLLTTLGQRARQGAEARARMASSGRSAAATTAPGAISSAVRSARSEVFVSRTPLVQDARPPIVVAPTAATAPPASATRTADDTVPDAPLPLRKTDAGGAVAGQHQVPRMPIILVSDTVRDARPFPEVTEPIGVRLHDVDHVPVLRSMAQVYDAIWEDDTHYMPSPFQMEELPRAPVTHPAESGVVVEETLSRSDGPVVVAEAPARPQPAALGHAGARWLRRENAYPLIAGVTVVVVGGLGALWTTRISRPGLDQPASAARESAYVEMAASHDPPHAPGSVGTPGTPTAIPFVAVMVATHEVGSPAEAPVASSAPPQPPASAVLPPRHRAASPTPTPSRPPPSSDWRARRDASPFFEQIDDSW